MRSNIQNKGVGAALVRDFETQVKLRGGLTIRLGTDDENNRTSIGGVEIYPNILEKLAKHKKICAAIRSSFTKKLGYEICGVIPDANGFGKHDILMAKRL